jgi:signal transduction histidine kinase/ligand-binding sensor domain-containing protein
MTLLTAVGSSRRFRFVSLAIGWLLAATTAAAAPVDIPLRAYVHTTWAHREGVPLGSVADITQTSDGYLWIGASEEGLLRFDGTRFTPIAVPCQAKVVEIEAASDGSLWMICDGRALRRSPTGQTTVMPHPAWPERPRTRPTLTADRVGRIWFLGTAVTYFNADGTAGPAMPGTEPLPSTTSTKFAHDRNGDVWYSDAQRLFRIRDDRAELMASPIVFLGLAPSAQGGILANQQTRIVHIRDRAMVPFASLGDIAATNGDVMVEADGVLWVGTRSRGMALIRGGVVETSGEPDDIGTGQVSRVFADREGTIWMGTSLGLQRFRRPLARLLTPREGIAGMPRFVFADRRGGLLLGAPQTVRLAGRRAEPVAPETIFRSVAEDSAGTVWAANGDDIGAIRGNRFVPVTAHDGTRLAGVYAIRRDEDGGLWALSQGSGLYRIEAGRPRLVHAGQFGSEFVVSRQTGLWIDLVGDGIVRSPDGIAPPVPVGGAPRRVHAMAGDGDALWVASEEGLSRWRNGTWTMWTSAHGLPGGGPVFEVLPHSDGRLWLMTRGGILVVPRDQLDATPAAAPRPLQFIRIGALDRIAPHVGGVQTSPRMTVATDGTLYVATRDTIAAIDPSQVSESSLRPSVLIETVAADHQSLSLDDTARLVEPERVQFDYTSLSLRSPENVRFRYRLEGHDADWIEAGGQRRVTYDALRPGTYRFRVIGSGSEGVWNLDGASFAFTVVPVFWRTSWFMAAAVTAVALLIFTGYRLRLRQVAREMNLRFDERLAERTRIARNLHDSLLQGTIAASLHLQIAEDRLRDEDSAKAPVQRGLQLLTHVMEEGRATVEDLRSPTDAEDLVQLIARRAREFADLDSVNLQIAVEGAVQPLHAAVHYESTHIVCEAIINAARHAAAGRIEVVVAYSAAALRCVVRDNGKGMTPDLAADGIDGHWGLMGMRERAQRIGATLGIASRPGGGTSVELTIPATLAFTAGEQPRRPRWWRRR